MIFKNTDNRFKAIGYTKVKEDAYGACYEKETEHGYTHCIDILHKHSGYHIVQSYEKRLNNDGFNNMVGLTMYELKLCLKKAKEKGYKYKR